MASLARLIGFFFAALMSIQTIKAEEIFSCSIEDYISIGRINESKGDYDFYYDLYDSNLYFEGLDTLSLSLNDGDFIYSNGDRLLVSEPLDEDGFEHISVELTSSGDLPNLDEGDSRVFYYLRMVIYNGKTMRSPHEYEIVLAVEDAGLDINGLIPLIIGDESAPLNASAGVNLDDISDFNFDVTYVAMCEESQVGLSSIKTLLNTLYSIIKV